MCLITPHSLTTAVVFAGNEGPIELFADNTGFMWDIAPEFGALVVFVEHRYYGSSLPFGNKTFSNDKADRLSFLTSEQALADYASIIPVIKAQFKATSSPVISFGGYVIQLKCTGSSLLTRIGLVRSYGGMLSAWLRIRYPWVVDGSIAASAPVLQFTGLTGPEAYNNVITNTFRKANATCPAKVYKAWSLIQDLSVDQMNEIFTPCTPLTDESDVCFGVCDWSCKSNVSVVSVPPQYMTIFNWLNGAIACAFLSCSFSVCAPLDSVFANNSMMWCCAAFALCVCRHDDGGLPLPHQLLGTASGLAGEPCVQLLRAGRPGNGHAYAR